MDCTVHSKEDRKLEVSSSSTSTTNVDEVSCVQEFCDIRASDSKSEVSSPADIATSSGVAFNSSNPVAVTELPDIDDLTDKIHCLLNDRECVNCSPKVCSVNVEETDESTSENGVRKEFLDSKALAISSELQSDCERTREFSISNVVDKDQKQDIEPIISASQSIPQTIRFNDEETKLNSEPNIKGQVSKSIVQENKTGLRRRPSEVAILTESILGELYEPFDGVKTQLVRQSRDILLCRYYGDYQRFKDNFLEPAANLLKTLKESYRVPGNFFPHISGSTQSEVPEPCHSCCAAKWKGWPLCFNRRLVVHLAELDAALLKPGDFYLCVEEYVPDSASPGVRLVTKCWIEGGIQDLVINDSDFSTVFTMERTWNDTGPRKLRDESDDLLAHLLQHLLVSVERGIERIEWETVTKPWTCNHVFPPASPAALSRCCHSNQVVDTKDSSVQTTPVEELRDRIQEKAATPGSSEKPGPGAVLHDGAKDINHSDSLGGSVAQQACPEGQRSFQGTDQAIKCTAREVSSPTTLYPTTIPSAMFSEDDQDDGYYDHTLAQPTTISQVDQDLIHSRLAILPGSRDVHGRSVVIVSSCALKEVTAAPSHLAQLLMYFHTIPKKEVISSGFLFLIDASGATEDTWAFLDEAFCLLEANIPNAINMVLVWYRHEKHVRLSKLFPSSRIKCEVVTGEEGLQEFISRNELLVEFGGLYAYDHQEWMSFRKFLEPFINGCRLSGRHLVALLEELRGSRLPSSSSLTHQMIELQKRHVSQTFSDEQLRHLEEEGDTILRELESYSTKSPHNSDYRENLERTWALYEELRRAIKKLSRLADKRLRKLEDCLHLRTFEEESSQVLSWLCQKGEDMLSKHQAVADTLSGIKDQEGQFEKFYFLAMRQIEKGNDLLEEATMISKGTPCPDSVASSVCIKPQDDGSNFGRVQDLAASLRHHISSFNERLEDTREKLEDTAKCYHLLDKTYEWALESMRFVSHMRLNSAISVEGINKLIKYLQEYQEDHPPVSEETFQEMLELASKLGNEKLLEQCKTAQLYCRETVDLIHTRQTTLLKSKQQYETELLCQTSLEIDDTPPPRTNRSNSQPINLWLPQGSSTPYQSIVGAVPFQRRRSIATPTSQAYGSPVGSYTSFPSNYYSASVLKESYQLDNYILEKGEQILNHGLITEDLTSHGPVTCISRTVLESRHHNKDGQSIVFENCKSLLSKGIAKVGISSQHLHKLQRRNPHQYQTWQLCEEALEKVVTEVREQNERLRVERLQPLPDNSNESISSSSQSEDHSQSDNSSKASYSDEPRGPHVANTHLLTRASTLDITESVISETMLNEEAAKIKKTLMLIMKEMIQTERDYVKSLEYIIENYIPELLRDDIPQALRGQRNVIFGNIEKIYELHSQYFLNELQQCENLPFSVGHCFLRYEPQFYLYALYNKNKPKSDVLMSEYGNQFFRKKQLELADKMDLASYLLKPVQRMGKYALLLKQLVKECSEREAEHQDLKAAEEMVRFQLRHGNDLLAMDALRDCDVNVKEQGRLLRQDEFLVWQGRSRKSLRHVFLFEELILFSKARRDPDRKGYEIYHYKNSIKTTDIGLTEQIGDSPTKFEIWFRKRKLNDIYVLQAPSPEVKMSWVQEISKLLWKQALRNREMRLAEMSSMGIGNKPCLDIKPSDDQINDRSISIHQLSRAPRFRNSITSSVFDQQHNKRPHSIISVSSSSSSGSSQSSFVFYGTLNLGFEPGDSPRPLHRSLTQQSQCSTESGFCTDVSMAGDSPLESEQPHKKAERSDSLLSSDSLFTTSSPESISSPTEDHTLDDSISTSM